MWSCLKITLHVCIDTCAHARTHTYTHSRTHLHMHSLSHTHTHTHSLTHAASRPHWLCFQRGELLSQDYTKSKDQSWGPSTSRLLTACLVFAVPSLHTSACFLTPLSITLLILTFIFSRMLNLGSTLAAETQVQSLRFLVYSLTFWSTKFRLFAV